MTIISSIIYYTIFGYITLNVLIFVWSFFRCYILTLFGFVANLKKYGEWVVVTGATDGIGKEYARQLAKQGFKVVLISRSLEKLLKVEKEIVEEFNVETRVIAFDFATDTDYDVINTSLHGLDIGILVNNVGMIGVYPDGFASTKIKEHEDVMNCNVMSDVQMTFLVSKGMTERKRGLVIHISSIAQYINIPKSLYGSTKTFMFRFAKSLQLEFSSVDHQVVTPGYVATNMSKVSPIKYRVPTPEEFVTSAIRTIGITDVTCGFYYFELQLVLIKGLLAVVNLLPRSFFKGFADKRARDRREKLGKEK